jgi:hypothetical protein
MHWDTYMRLAIEYERLQVLMWGELAINLGVDLLGPMPGAPLSRAETAEALETLWADYRRNPTAPPADLVARTLDRLHEADQPVARRRSPVRRTLGQTAKTAEIPLDFAREAQREGLLRPDAGRTKRVKRYRPKVACWLGKLHTLRRAGLSWADLRAWTARRFLPEHEHERRWPAGYAPP